MPSRVSPSFRRPKHITLLLVILAPVLVAVTLVAQEPGGPVAAARKIISSLANKGNLTPAATSVGPRQSSPVALAPDDRTLVNVNPEVNTVTILDVLTDSPAKIAEIAVGRDPSSVAIHPDGTKAYVANSFDGTVSIVNLTSLTVTGTFSVGTEPMAVALSPNGSRLYVANSASNNLMVFDTTSASPTLVATVDLSALGTAPRAIGITNDGDTDDTDETVFVALFYAQLRPGKTATDEGQDDQREGHVAAISAATNTVVGTSVLGPMANTGFNSNGQLAPGGPPAGNPAQPTPAVASTNPQFFTTPTGAFPNQLASIAIQPGQSRAYVVGTAASPNGPLRFVAMAQGLVSIFDTGTRAEIVAAQTGSSVRQTAPLNLNQGINLGTTPAPRLFLTNPVAMTWRPNGSDAWIAVQQSDLIVRATTDANGIPTVNNPLVAGPSTLVRVDLQAVAGGQISGNAPQGLVINSGGTRLYSFNFVSRSITIVNISNATAPVIAGTARASALPDPGPQDAGPQAIAHLGEQLFFSGRGPQGRMSQEAWGACVVCHPKGRSDNITWMFDAGPRQTISLDGTFAKVNPHDQRILNWSGIRDENQDFELNTRAVFGGRGLIDDDRLFLALGGTSGATPTDSSLVEQFNNQFTGAVSTTNDLSGGAALPALLDARRDFAIATLGDDRVFIIGGRSGAGDGTLINDANTVLEFNPRTNTLTPRNATGFTPRHSLGAAAVRTSQGFRIYAVGGYESTMNTTAPSGKVEEYNPTTDTWRSVASLPTAVAQFGITAAGGINTAEPIQLIHVVSGNTGSEAAPSVANPNPVQRFQADPSGPGTWSAFTLPGLTLRRNHGIATAIRGTQSRIFVIGGQDGGGTVLATVEEYAAQAVVAIGPTTPPGAPFFGPHPPRTSLNAGNSAVPTPRARFGIGSTLTTNQIYVIGGVDGTGTDQTTVLEYSVANNDVANVGNPGTPTGAWLNRGNLSVARRGLQVSTPPGVTNFLPVANSGRDANQDAIAAWVATIRSARAPVSPLDPGAVNGKTLFNTVGLVVPGFSCATCHSGPKFTASTVDYTTPPSPEVGLGLGNQRVIGAELRQTATQNPAFPAAGLAPGVLINVGTFAPNSPGGRVNEIRANAADPGQAIAPLGANGFNIPSLLSLPETGPYFYSGLAQTLDQVLDGSQDGNGGVRHHFVTSGANRADLVKYLKSVQPPVADLSITKTASPNPINAGGNITYTLTVSSGGPDDAQNVVVTDTTPANTTFQSFSQGSGPAASVTTPGLNGTGTITISTATFPANTTATYFITVKVNSGTPVNTVISNTASITSAAQDLNSANNSSTATTTVGPLVASGTTLSAFEGVAFANKLVATFNNSNPGTPAGNYTATINWGDGTSTSAGTIVSNGGGSFSVTGGHTYAEEGLFNLTVTIHDVSANFDASVNTAATVVDAPLSIATLNAGANTTFSGVGGNNTSVTAGTANAALGAFQTAIGGVNNGATASPQNGGFRAINWDGVALDGTDFGGATTVIVPNFVVGIPVNRFQERGINFEEVYAVSGPASGADPSTFTTVNPGVSNQFPAFSPTKTFAMFNDNTIDFNFVLPSVHNTSVPIQAVTRGFGAIFRDVETPNTTSIEYFNGTTSLGKFFVPTGTSGQAEFFGVLFQNPVVTNVTITLGNATLFSFNGTSVTSGPADNPGGGVDLAVTDDFVYPEPTAVSTGINISAIVGAPFTARVASFTDADSNGQASDFSVVIDWGDGTTSSGGVTPNSASNDTGGSSSDANVTITPAVAGGFDVTGTHTYATTGTFTITTSVRDIGGASISAKSTATVSGLPALSIGNVAVTEGNSGTTNAPFTVTLSSASTQTVTVDYVTGDGTATAPSDYDAQAGTLTFAPGVTTRTINVAVKGDTVPEPNETFFVTLLNPVNATISTAQGTGTINDDDESGFVQFSAATTSVAENAGSVSLTVSRTGDTSGVTTVNFETSDGTAVQKSDYTFGFGTIQFGPGDTSKTIQVLLVDDVFVEAPETFKVTLSNASGNFVVGTPNQITVTITDNDAGGAANPIDNAQFFVRQHYLDFLGREADAGGLSFWTNQITVCGANASCIDAARVNVSAAFFLSIEYQETSGNVFRTQRVAFGRLSSDASSRVPYLQFMRDTRQIGAGVIVGQPGFDVLLDQNKQAYAVQIVNSAGFLARFPIMPAAPYVDALYASAGVTPTAAERTAAINAFGAGGTAGRVAGLRSVSDSNSLRQAELNSSFVLAEYYGYLRRNPTDAPDFSDSGYQFWLNKLNSFNGDFVKAEMVRSFIVSSEYRQRFGP